MNPIQAAPRPPSRGAAGLPRWAAVTVLLVLGMELPGAQAQVWDVAAQFSPTLNPSGPWSYGCAAGAGVYGVPSLRAGYTFHPYPSHGTVADGGPLNGLQWWRTGAPSEPGSGYNPFDHDMLVGSVVRIPARHFAFHPDDARNAFPNSILRWTAPQNGGYRMEAEFWPSDRVNFGIELYITLNASSFLMERRVISYPQRTTYTNDLLLRRGDTVDCVVGPVNDAGYDTTVARVRFEQTSSRIAEDRDKSSLGTEPNLGRDGMPHCSGAGSSPIFTKSGNYRNRSDDAVLPARGMPLQITRFYNSVDDYAGPFSHSWAFNYAIQLMRVTDPEGNEHAVVRWANGVRKYFLLTNGVYQAGVNCYDTLVSNTPPNPRFTLRSKSGLRLHFNAEGFLTSQQDPNGNEITFSYDARKRLSQARNADGRYVDYHYNAQGRIGSITDWTTRRWEYEYDSRDDLVKVTYPDGAAVRYTYDANHQITAITDARGNQVGSLTYSGETGRATSYTDGSDVSYAMSYDAANRTALKTDSLSAVEQFGFNAYGNKTHWSNPLGAQMQFAWSSNQHLVAITDPLGRQNGYSYDAWGNILAVTNALGQVWRYTYETNFHRRTSLTAPNGTVITNAYDTRGNLAWTRDPRGFTSVYRYDALGQLTNVANALDRHTSMTYDSHGQLASVQDALGQMVRFTYDAAGNQSSRTDPGGQVWGYAYDVMGRLTAVTNPLGQVTRKVYDANGNVTAVTDTGGRTLRLGYDAFDRLVAVTNALGAVTRHAYDAYGRLLSSCDALGNVVSNTYDVIGRRTAVTDPLGGRTLYAYDATGNQVQVTDALANVTRYTYDALNRTVAITNALGGVTRYTYDANGNTVAVIDANNHTSTAAYDSRNTVTNSANALGLGYRYDYDANNNLIARTDPNGVTLACRYDALDRLTHVVFPDGTSIATSYDPNGNVLQVSSPDETVRYAYDALNRLTNVLAVGLGKAVGYEYDAAGNRAAMTDPDGGRTRYEYDELDRLTALRDPAGNRWTFAYDAINRMTGASLPNGVTASCNYSATDRMTNLVYRGSGGKVLQSFDYSFDALGNPLRVQREDSLHEVYRYDQLNQLTRVDYDSPKPDGPSAQWTRYNYDPVGNRLSLSSPDGEVAYGYDAADRLLAVTAPGEVIDLQWDNNGNLMRSRVNGSSTTYSWDALNRLRGIVHPDGRTSAFTYYADGLRHGSSDATGIRRYLYDGPNPLQELDATGTPRAQYVYSLGVDAILARQTVGGTGYYLRDGLGSVSGISSESGDLPIAYRYDAFGALRRTTGTTDNNALFTARTLDSDSGLYYYRARYLDPKLGRFLSADAVQSGHAYTYVRNRPGVLTDPSGHLGEIGPSAGLVGFFPSQTGLERVPRYSSNAEAARAQHYTVFNTTEEAYSGYAPGQKQFGIFCGSLHMPPPATPRRPSQASASTVSGGLHGSRGDPARGATPGGGMGGGDASAPAGFGGGGVDSIAEKIKSANQNGGGSQRVSSTSILNDWAIENFYKQGKTPNQVWGIGVFWNGDSVKVAANPLLVATGEVLGSLPSGYGLSTQFGFAVGTKFTSYAFGAVVGDPLGLTLGAQILYRAMHYTERDITIWESSP